MGVQSAGQFLLARTEADEGSELARFVWYNLRVVETAGTAGD
jgi:hypothetical protein